MKEVKLSLLPAAKRVKTTWGLTNIWTRARKRADLWERLLADWPGNALAKLAREDAEAIDALFYERVNKK